MKQSKTNELTQAILDQLYSFGAFAWRQNTLPVPMARNGVLVGFKPAAKSGLPDIIAVLTGGGRILCVEIKVGADKLRPAQIGFKKSIETMGGLSLVVKSLEDFEEQFSHIRTELSTL